MPNNETVTVWADEWSVVGPRILVRRDKTELQKLSSILAIPEETLEKDARANISGVVLQIGEQAYNLPSQATREGDKNVWCNVGDRVIFGQYAGTKILMEGAENLVVLNDEDIIAVKRGGTE